MAGPARESSEFPEIADLQQPKGSGKCSLEHIQRLCRVLLQLPFKSGSAATIQKDFGEGERLCCSPLLVGAEGSWMGIL